MDNYLGSEQETMPAMKDQPVLHDSLLRYVTETKYLIDLVPTQKEIASDKPATETIPEQSSSSSTASSSETEDEGDNSAQNLADGNISNRWRSTTRVLKALGKMLMAGPRSTPHPPAGGGPAVEW